MTAGELFDPDVGSTVRTIDLGSRRGVDEAYEPHHVRVWNAGADPRRIGLAIDDQLGEDTVLDRSFTIPPDAALQVTLLEPSRYLLAVSTTAAGSCHELRVPCDLFDCNWSSTTIGIFEHGAIRSLVSSTTEGCDHYEC